jgi:hydroxyacyl-ACP dehydratase HTD2-like protein with hotdog domain
MKQQTIESISVGDQLPVLHKSADEAQLFLYSAASFNPHRIHYDRTYAEFEGHTDIIVHGPLQGSWLTQFVTDWAGPASRLLNITWQNRASALVGENLEFHGSVTKVNQTERTALLSLEERNKSGAILMPATALIKLPSENTLK